MREHATLKLTDGRELPVEVESDDLDRVEILVRKLEGVNDPPGSFLQIIDAHLATAAEHPAGATDRLLEDDRSRPF